VTLEPHPGHEKILLAAGRAPSAHNAQPWRLVPLPNGASYELHYVFEDKLDADPDDRDAFLAMGAFYETLLLASHLHNNTCEFVPALAELATGFKLGVVSIAERASSEPADPLASAIESRITNRHPYQKVLLPKGLQTALIELGCTLLEPTLVAPLVSKASVMAWKDRRFIDDLKKWTRFHDGAPDGLTPACLNLNSTDRSALRFALARGRLPAALAWVYARRDVRLTKASSAVAVLSVDDRVPLTMFECGRRLLRCWVTITGAQHSYHPISIVIDQATAPELTRMAGVSHAVAIFRVGFTPEPAVVSNRRPLGNLLMAPQQNEA